MLFARFVVQQHLALQNVFEKRGSNDAPPVGLGRGAEHHGLERVVGGTRVAVGELGDAFEQIIANLDLLAPKAALGVGERPPEQTDRKSTRLNSSHLGISYAVFCLKKKKEKDRLFSNLTCDLLHSRGSKASHSN